MKKLTIVFMVFVFLSIVSAAYAHPPSDIKITFDQTKNILSAVIVHNVSNPAKHYINKVDIGLNGKEIIEQTISKQENNLNQTVSYLLTDVKDGDVLSVEGYCNLSGKLKKEITIRLGK